MGLDTVELVMDLEERFDTSIPDSAAEGIRTVGELHQFLMNRIQNQNSDSCSSAVCFYSIRNLLITEFGVDRKDVRPATALESLIRSDKRAQFWKKLELSLATQLPGLKRSKWLQWQGDIFPDSCSTVAQLVDQCVGSTRITKDFGKDDSVAVWNAVCQVISKVAGVEPSEITPETSFVKDLGF